MQTKFNSTELFYIILESETGECLSDNGEIEGWYDYALLKDIAKNSNLLVFNAIENCKCFTDKVEAEAKAIELHKNNPEYSYEVLTVAKNNVTLYTLENTQSL